MSSKHTPGPWKVVGQRTHGPSTGARDITQTMIAVPHENGPWEVIGVRSRNEDADAHLIAAAPDLLEACEVALKSAISFLGDGETSPVRRKLLAAIKRARGES